MNPKKFLEKVLPAKNPLTQHSSEKNSGSKKFGENPTLKNRRTPNSSEKKIPEGPKNFEKISGKFHLVKSENQNSF